MTRLKRMAFGSLIAMAVICQHPRAMGAEAAASKKAGQIQGPQQQDKTWFDLPVIILPLWLSDDLEEQRTDWYERIEQGLRASGLDAKSASTPIVLNEDNQQCAEAACLAELAQKADSRFVAFTHIATTPESYTVHVRIMDARGAALLGASETTCALEDPCPPMPQTVLRAAKKAGQKAHEAIAGLPVPAPGSAAHKASAPLYTTPSGFGPTEINLPSLDRQPKPLWHPLVLAAAGAVAIGAGAYLLAIHNRCVEFALTTPRTCNTREETAVAGGIATAAGGVALITGVAVAWYRYRDNRAYEQRHPTRPDVAWTPLFGGQAAWGLQAVGRF